MNKRRGETLNPLVALVVMAVCAFAVVMYNVYLDKLQRLQHSNGATNHVERGNTQELLSDPGALHTPASLAADAKLLALVEAVQTKQQHRLQSLAEKIQSTTDAPILFNYALQSAIEQDNVEATEYLLSVGALCDASTDLGAQLIDKAVASSDFRITYMLARNDCGWNLGDSKTRIVQQLMASDSPKRVEYIATDKDMVTLRPQLLIRFIQTKNTEEAIDLLYEGVTPNATTKDGKTTALELSIQNNLTQVAQRLIELNADAVIEQRDATRYAIVTAQDYRQIDIARALLKKDPNHLKLPGLVKRLLEGLRGFVNTSDISNWLQLLLDHGVTLDTAPGVDVSLLRKAIGANDYDLTKRLLELGADVNALLITTTLLTEAQTSKSESGQQIVKLLQQHGAVDDVLVQVRRRRPSSVIEPCKLGETLSIPRLAEAQEKMQSFIRGRDKNKAPNQSELCVHALKYCNDNSVDVDDCLTSLPTCSDADQGQYTLCCEANIKRDYFKARCAGLTPHETRLWLDF